MRHTIYAIHSCNFRTLTFHRLLTCYLLGGENHNFKHQHSHSLLQTIELESLPQMQFTSLMLRLGVVDSDDVLVDNGNNAGSGGKWKDVECVLERKLGAAEGTERLFKDDNLFVDLRSRREG